jgi:K+-transporting ATPase ATPase C chain
MDRMLRPALSLLALSTLLLGFAYPAFVTGVGQALFSDKANGSIIRENGRAVGSALVGQSFSAPGFFWGRPSSTKPTPYNGAASTGSNLGPTNPVLFDTIRTRIATLRAADPGNATSVPVDLVTASGSGLDPHISPSAAYFQVGRVARARGLPETAVRRIVEEHIEGTRGFFGERRVNVLRLNLAVEKLAKRDTR